MRDYTPRRFDSAAQELDIDFALHDAGPGQRIAALITVRDPQEEQVFTTAADLRMLWVHRPASMLSDPGPLLAALQGIGVPSDTYVWIAAEAKVARALRQHFLLTLGHPKTWIKASGYWLSGQANTTERFSDQV